MDRVREALLLVAEDVDRSRLGTVADVQARGERIVRRRRVTAGLAGVGVALVVVLAVVLGSGVLRATPVPVQPRPTPKPSVVAPVTVARGGCGHGIGCPTGTGPFRVVLESGRAGDQLSVAVPAGWSMVEQSGNVALMADKGANAGLSMVWPVRALSGALDAHGLAQQLARQPGATASTPRPVSVDGHAGWQVTFAQPPAGRGTCLDPRLGAYVGEHYVPPEAKDVCHVLFDLAPAEQGKAADLQPVGTSGGAPLTLTLLDGLGVKTVSGASILAVWSWAPDLLSASPRTDVVTGLRFGHFFDPACGGDAAVTCVATGGKYVARGDPVKTEAGIHQWLSAAAFRIPSGWGSVVDDGRGSVGVGANAGRAGAQLVWEPRLPGSPPTAGLTAHELALGMAGLRGVVASVPRSTRVAGHAAWRVDVSTPKGAAPFQDDSCLDAAWPYSVRLVCTSTAADQNGSLAIDVGMRARLWFVDASPGHVLMVAVWGERTHVWLKPDLGRAVAAAQPLVDSLVLTTS